MGRLSGFKETTGWPPSQPGSGLMLVAQYGHRALSLCQPTPPYLRVAFMGNTMQVNQRNKQTIARLISDKMSYEEKCEWKTIQFVLSHVYKERIENRQFSWNNKRVVAELFCAEISLGEALAAMVDASPTTQGRLDREARSEFEIFKKDIRDKYKIYWDHNSKVFVPRDKLAPEKPKNKRTICDVSILNILEVGDKYIYSSTSIDQRHYIARTLGTKIAEMQKDGKEFIKTYEPEGLQVSRTR